MSDQIQHHGIQGQRWGVKNGPPYPITRREIAYDKNAGETVSKGTTLYRVSGTKDDISNDIMYVTYKKYDREYYRSAWAPIAQKNAKGDGNVYEHKFSLNEDLHIPSFNERNRMLREVCKNNKNEVYKALTMRSLAISYPSMSLDEIKRLPKECPDVWASLYKKYVGSSTFCDSVKQDGYDISYIASASIAYSDKLMQEYKKESLKNGYNVIFDDYGTTTIGSNGSNVRMNDSPLILLNPSKQCTQVETKTVSLKEQNKSRKEYLKWQKGTSAVIKNTPLSIAEADYRKGAELEEIKHSSNPSIYTFKSFVKDLKKKLRSGEVIFTPDAYGMLTKDNGEGVRTMSLRESAKQSFLQHNDICSDQIQHHGIQGQRWGRRNGPPYPLNAAGKERFKVGLKKAGESVAKSAAAAVKKTKKVSVSVAKAGTKKIRDRYAKYKDTKNQKKLEEGIRTNNKKLIKKSIRDMSDEELEANLKRIRTENNYRAELAKTPEAKAKAARQEKIANTKKVVGDFIKTAAIEYAKKQVGIKNQYDDTEKTRVDNKAKKTVTRETVKTNRAQRRREYVDAFNELLNGHHDRKMDEKFMDYYFTKKSDSKSDSSSTNTTNIKTASAATQAILNSLKNSRYTDIKITQEELETYFGTNHFPASVLKAAVAAEKE